MRHFIYVGYTDDMTPALRYAGTFLHHDQMDVDAQRGCGARGRSNALNIAMEARFMQQSSVLMSPAFYDGDALFFCIEVRA